MSPSALIRSWPTLAAWGAGLLQFGIGAGAITKGADAAARGTGVLLVSVGAAALLWGVVALAKARIVAPRSGMVLGLVGIAAPTAALLVDPVGVSAYAVGVAVLLSLVVGVSAAVTVRRSRRDTSDSPAPRGAPVTSVLGLVVGCVVISGLVTPALGSTAVGSDAPSHSEHQLVFPGHDGH